MLLHASEIPRLNDLKQAENQLPSIDVEHGRSFGRQSDYRSVGNRGAPCQLGARTVCGARTARVPSYSGRIVVPRRPERDRGLSESSKVGARSSPTPRACDAAVCWCAEAQDTSSRPWVNRLPCSPGQPRPSEKIGRASTRGVSKHKPGAFELTTHLGVLLGVALPIKLN